jgi:transposase
MVDIDQIKKLHVQDGLSIRQIHKITGFDRRTISKWCKSNEFPTYSRNTEASPVKDRVISFIQNWIGSDLELIKDGKRRTIRTAAKMWDDLTQMGFQVSESSVRRYVRQLKPRPIFIQLSYDPGCDMQVDWGELWIDFDRNISLKVYLFVATLPYSNSRFVYPYFKQDSICFFDGLKRAFEFFGGVPKRVTFDNLTSAVKKVLTTHHRIEQDKMLHFKHYYHFESNYCNVGKGNEKGHVENGVQYAKNNILGGSESFKDFDSLRDYLESKCKYLFQKRHYKNTKQTIGQRLDEERPQFTPLPDQPYESSRDYFVKRSKMSTISVDGVSYSVPSQCLSDKLKIKVTADSVHIYDPNQSSVEIAYHKRTHKVFSSEVLDYKHYLSVIAQKPKALNHALCIKQASFPKIFDDYLAMLQRHHPDPNREMIKILLLEKNYSLDDIFFAMEWCYEHRSYSYDSVRLFLTDLSRSPVPIEPITNKYPELQDHLYGISHYDRVIGG